MMTIPRGLADLLARLMQKAPGSSQQSPETSFAEIDAITEDIEIPTRHGRLPATVYLPSSDVDGHSRSALENLGSRGVYVNFHGGGFVLRHPEQDDPLCRFLAARAGVTVLNVDYTPAPQSRFPGPIEQAYDVVKWATEASRPWDGARCAVGGQSAGGSLAAGAARLALENGLSTIELQVLMYPALDLSIPSSQKWTADKEKFLVYMGPIFNAVYCPDESRRRDRLISPAGKYDTAPLDRIAPALVVTCGRDILRDEGVRYADRLEQAGSLIDHIDLPEAGHGFNILGASREAVLPVYERIAETVRQLRP
ncbi:alpha/beta hydrolase [Brevibacterium sp. UCMA 11754]|uniref:alpha/beta hydrolase n=1 Tax=Brevibacterium sp. UCMA 11754 TaxID=2749198 RepID=UPI001F36074B|nr:alpha/beta hydrolase [Brevibacterium sp. UCMA 11754]MCF2570553.1 alpha/beta hydrolase fold domain-containing protein [Brevibacterium sp. UCMA 11754]